uniref:Uncharacterized protein n=1 Tax=Kalanchoe fedtschenkoi TaxID=63787 RepID=A0A7N0T089_KALFE
MAQHLIIRPLTRRWPKLQNPACSFSTTVLRLQNLIWPAMTKSNACNFPLVLVHSGNRGAHFKPRGLRLRNTPVPSEMQQSKKEESEAEERRSRNEKKRLARQAVRCGMELAELSDSQIKRILKAVNSEPELFEAIALVKRFGNDVREGKRRQFNYIGKLLRDVDSELIEELIRAAKDGGLTQVLASHGPVSLTVEEDADDEQEEEDLEEEESDEEDKVTVSHIETASRWFDGLVSKDLSITKEVYSISSVEFDRQELRKLVRNVQLVQEQQDNVDENSAELDLRQMRAQKSLNHFLFSLAKRMPSD